MSVKGIHWARDAAVEPYRKALLYALGERHNIDTGLCKPDQQMLARDAGMTDRTVRKYVRLLEQEGFITRGMQTTPTGRETHYILHFDVTEPLNLGGVRKDVPDGVRKDVPDGVRKDVPDGGSGTPVPDPSGTPVPDPSGTCVPVHKKKHESTRRNTNPLSGKKPDARRKQSSGSRSRQHPAVDETAVLKAFEDIWTLWPRQGRERSRSRAMVLDQLRRHAKTRSVAEIVMAARAFVAATEAAFVPGLDRWLKQGRYEHFMPKDLAERAAAPAAGDRPATQAPSEDWAAHVARYARSGIWPNRLGDRPDEPRYRGALAPLEALMANGRFGQLNVAMLKFNIDRLRAAEPRKSTA